MNIETLYGFVLLTISPVVGAELPGEALDYNFDGHMDYRVLTLPNAKASQFDVFIFDPELGIAGQ